MLNVKLNDMTNELDDTRKEWIQYQGWIVWPDNELDNTNDELDDTKTYN